MIRGKRLTEFEEQREDQIYNMRVQQIVSRYKHATRAILVFTIFCFSLAIYRHLLTKSYLQDGNFYRNIRSSNITTDSQSTIKSKEGNLIVNNQQFSQYTWIILQLSAVKFPQEFGSELIDKFNIFIKLFGEFYPYKKSRDLYFQILQQNGPFVGKTREQAVVFVCQLHNKMNNSIGKATVDCLLIQKQLRNSH